MATEIKDHLKAQGYSDEEIAEGMKNEKFVNAMAKALEKAGLVDSAQQAVSDAKAEALKARTESDEFWAAQKLEMQKAIDAQKALKEQNDALNAQLASFRTYNKTLKEQGYAAPEEFVNMPEPEPDKPMTRKEWEAEQRKVQARSDRDILASQQLSNEYQSLYGTPYLTVQSDYEEARKASKPYTEFVRGKYGFDKKRDEIKAAEQAKLNAAEVDKLYKAKEAELTAKYGNMPELRPPSVSSSDVIREKFKVDIPKNMKPAERKEATRQIWASLPKVQATKLVQ